MATTTVSIRLVHETCFKCGVSFGLEESQYERAANYGKTFYCTNGHGQVYTESELARVKKKAERMERDREFWRRQSSERAEQVATERRRAAAYKGVATRTKNRIERGVCPHCRRSFENVREHMQTRHADKIGQPAEAVS